MKLQLTISPSTHLLTTISINIDKLLDRKYKQARYQALVTKLNFLSKVCFLAAYILKDVLNRQGPISCRLFHKIEVFFYIYFVSLQFTIINDERIRNIRCWVAEYTFYIDQNVHWRFLWSALISKLINNSPNSPYFMTLSYNFLDCLTCSCPFTLFLTVLLIIFRPPKPSLPRFYSGFSK